MFEHSALISGGKLEPPYNMSSSSPTSCIVATFLHGWINLESVSGKSLNWASWRIVSTFSRGCWYARNIRATLYLSLLVRVIFNDSASIICIPCCFTTTTYCTDWEVKENNVIRHIIFCCFLLIGHFIVHRLKLLYVFAISKYYGRVCISGERASWKMIWKNGSIYLSTQVCKSIT